MLLSACLPVCVLSPGFSSTLCVCASLRLSSCVYTHCPECASLPAENAKKLAGTGVSQRYSVECDRSRISVRVPFPLPTHLGYTPVPITHAYSIPQRSLYIVLSCKYITPMQTYFSHRAGNYQPTQAQAAAVGASTRARGMTRDRSDLPDTYQYSGTAACYTRPYPSSPRLCFARGACADVPPLVVVSVLRTRSCSLLLRFLRLRSDAPPP